MPPFLATYIEVTNENLLGECRILWGERERVAQWFGNVAEFEQGQNILLTSYDRQTESSANRE